MKKFTIFVCGLVMVFGLIGVAGAIPLPIKIGDGGSLTLTPWFGEIDYSSSALSSSLELEIGSSASVDLFELSIISGYGIGEADVEIDFELPVASGAGSGFWAGYGSLDFTAGFLVWGGDITVPYGLDDTVLLTLSLDHLFGITTDSPLIISGTVTLTDSEAAAAPVPEPATILLMGTGLLGLVAYSRKRFRQKS